jgi:Thrombospondin type 3 repeat
VRRSACLALLASVFVGGGAAPGWAADPTLDGEVLSQHIRYVGPVSGICDVDPVSGTESYTFEFAGAAGGPFPGTFEASVQVAIEPETTILNLPVFPDGFSSGQSADDFIAAGGLVVVDSQFTIDSTQALVAGETTLFGVARDAEHAGVCAELAGGDPDFDAFGAYKDVRAWDGEYAATISTPAGDFEDFGFADLQGRQAAICSGIAPDGTGTCPPVMGASTELVNANDFSARFESVRDVDGDGLPDVVDNCPDVANPDQQDTDGDEDGDACDADDDNDGVADAGDA